MGVKFVVFGGSDGNEEFFADRLCRMLIFVDSGGMKAEEVPLLG